MATCFTFRITPTSSNKAIMCGSCTIEANGFGEMVKHVMERTGTVVVDEGHTTRFYRDGVPVIISISPLAFMYL